MDNGQKERDQAYLEASNMASKMLQNGEIIAHSTTHCPDRGRVISVESDQGWNPDPFYQDFYEEVASSWF